MPIAEGDWATDLFVAHARPLLRAAVLLLADAGEAEEVVQEAFARLLSKWSPLRQPERAAGYLLATTLNLARGRLRRRGSARRFLASEPKHEDAAVSVWAAECPVDELAIARQDRGAVVEALRRLPARQKECLVLRYYLGLSEAEIAEAMGVSRGSVKTHASRGQAALATALEAQR
jgi:RNA polymerase sigma factor (sigma-70 family)